MSFLFAVWVTPLCVEGEYRNKNTDTGLKSLKELSHINKLKSTVSVSFIIPKYILLSTSVSLAHPAAVALPWLPLHHDKLKYVGCRDPVCVIRWTLDAPADNNVVCFLLHYITVLSTVASLVKTEELSGEEKKPTKSPGPRLFPYPPPEHFFSSLAEQELFSYIALEKLWLLRVFSENNKNISTIISFELFQRIQTEFSICWSSPANTVYDIQSSSAVWHSPFSQ